MTSVCNTQWIHQLCSVLAKLKPKISVQCSSPVLPFSFTFQHHTRISPGSEQPKVRQSMCSGSAQTLSCSNMHPLNIVRYGHEGVKLQLALRPLHAAHNRYTMGTSTPSPLGSETCQALTVSIHAWEHVGTTQHDSSIRHCILWHCLIAEHSCAPPD